MKTSVVIFAAGSGTRMKSSTPKVLHKISGKPMLYFVIKEALNLSDDVVVVLYHKASLIQEEMEKFFKDKIKFVIQDHENFPGTGGAIKKALEAVKNDKVLVLNGDMPLVKANELKKLIVKEPVSMSILDLSNASGYGRVIIKDDKVVKIVEQKDCNEEELKVNTANAGVYCFDKNFLEKFVPLLSNNNAQKEYYITDLVEMAVENNIPIKPIFVKEENFKGVNTKFDLANAETIHQNELKEKLMKDGVLMRNPQTIYIEYGVEFEGECVIENNVTLLDGAKIISSTIKANTIVENSTIKNSTIGPFARIRPNSNIVESKIGNFVEVKKSTLNGVKAGHLSYLGDSQIDEGTNIGAGVITCNYDGKKKYQTKIGKNVFVGSDSQLIAPVVVEDDVIIAAGTTVVKEVKKGSLAISRVKMTLIKDFFYKFFGDK